MNTISRKEFIEQVGFGAAFMLIASCAGACKKASNPYTPPSNVNFTVNVSTGALATKGGYLLQDGVIVAHTNSGTFVAVSATCTHQGGTVDFSTANVFMCPIHGATFDTTGAVLSGPASSALQKYNTSLSGNNLRVYS